MKNLHKGLVSVFATAVLAAAGVACGGESATEKEATLAGLQAQDQTMFQEMGFEITARTGYGLARDSGQLDRPEYNGKDTDICYTLIKPAEKERGTYTACVARSQGMTSIQGLKSIEARQ